MTEWLKTIMNEPWGCAFYLFIRQPHGSEVSPAARNTLDSARIPRASKLLICGLFQKGRVLAQDGDGLPGQRPPRTGLLAPAACYGNVKRAPIRISRGPRKPSGSPKLPAADVRVLLLVTASCAKTQPF